MIPNEQKLLSLLSNNDVTFYSPPYQRNYEWEKEQCRIFMEDIKRTAESNLKGDSSEHFFGSITYFQTETAFGQPDKLVLIDGQQRITTTMLFLIALRDITESGELKRFIDSKYLKNNNVDGDNEYKIKLKQVESDWRVYKDLVLSLGVTDKGKSSAVYRNYLFFVQELRKLENEDMNLSMLVEKGLNKFSVVTIELQPDKNKWENPQEIFESMNSLGKPLSLADLVRNYLLLGLTPDEQDDLYHRYWLHIEDTLPGQISNFIRDYMQAKERTAYSKARESNYKSLYSEFKIAFSDCEAAELMKSLSAYSDIYACIVLGKDSGSKAVNKRLEDMRTVGATIANSFLMELLMTWKNGKFSEGDLISIIDALLIFFIRRRVIGLSGAENKIVPQLTKNIPELISSDDKKTAMFDLLSNQDNSFRLPNDIEMSRELSTMNFYNSKLCKFVLSLVEEKITKNRPDLSDGNLTIEHIMPQTLNDKWISYLGDDCEAMHQELVHNIGNLTLIRHNSELGQKTFDEKKEIYIHNSGLQVAKDKITDQERWDRQAIEERADWLIKYILEKVLPIPEKRKKINNFSPKKGGALSFIELQLIGENINFIKDPAISARVVSDVEVEFEGKTWRLSPLTRELFIRRGEVNKSGAYQGAQYWMYDGIKLADII